VGSTPFIYHVYISLFEANHPDEDEILGYGDPVESAEVRDPEDIANQYLRDYDDNMADYPDYPRYVWVRSPDGKICGFKIFLELSPIYTAHKLGD